MDGMDIPPCRVMSLASICRLFLRLRGRPPNCEPYWRTLSPPAQTSRRSRVASSKNIQITPYLWDTIIRVVPSTLLETPIHNNRREPARSSRSSREDRPLGSALA